MKANGVRYIYLGPVDNVLLKVGDPLSLGYMVKGGFDIVSHYIRKRNPEEKVGIHVTVNGAVKICEYSEVSKDITEMRNSQGELVYGHGSRATMYVTTDFIEKITSDPETVEKINKKYVLSL
jgi:UDP-N-acetylglucosamine/UDP-N-acetylgalactosamine diphosphorylase